MKKFIFIMVVVLMIAGIAACSGAAPGAPAAQPTPLPTVIVDMSTVAEGRIVPKEDVTISFLASGQVAEVLVEEGDTVEVGTVVARLGNREEIESNLANIRVELLGAEQARQALIDNVSLQRSTLAREISTTNLRLRDAKYALDNWTVPSNQKDLTAMEAVVIMKEALDEARDAYELVKYRPSGDSLREDRKDDLDSAQSDYNAAVRRLELETEVSDALTQLDRVMNDFQTLEDGPDPDDMAAAEARITAAQAAITAAEAALSRLELKATISGMILEQNLVVGQSVSPGTPVMRIVDFSEMFVETEDLTELEVVDVEIGQSVMVRADALRDVELTGEVIRISNIFEEKRGDITYTVRILLDNFDPRLRWGMTVEVSFE
ncbi:MAG TPA: efflux RND transporter periplasmic adaptor subunit [Anaerolineales bacterium]|nr:efflux RND transporter periplasmic adaptor subunit [Anaerolineales bacterium]